MTPQAQAPWLVWVFFSGLILFVRDPYTDRITHAVLVDGREGYGHVPPELPANDPSCKSLIESDFHHHPAVWWSTGVEGGPVLSTGSDALRRVMGKELEARGEIVFEWHCPGANHLERCGFERADYRPWDGALESPGCATGIGKTHEPGACPVGPRGGSLTGLPQPYQVEPEPGYRRSFYWVPHLQDLGATRRVARNALEGTGDGVHKRVFARSPLAHGRISSGDFGWVYDEAGPGVPRLLFDSAGDTALSRAGAEVVVWELEPPSGATELVVLLRPFDGGAHQELARFRPEESPIRLTVSNNPKRRCLGRPHPGRSGMATASHFQMLYELLDAPAGQRDATVDIVMPHSPQITRRWGVPVLAPPNIATYRPWTPQPMPNANPRQGTMSHDSTTSVREIGHPQHPFGDIADAVGTKERPICVPASSDG